MPGAPVRRWSLNFGGKAKGMHTFDGSVGYAVHLAGCFGPGKGVEGGRDEEDQDAQV